MKADTLTVKELFQKDVRYVIPPFQRPYVWSQEKQWEPLWEDVQAAAERYLDALDEAEDAAEAEAGAGRHFLGAAVFQQVPTPAAEPEKRLIIDGQQRLTTLQLLLDAAQEVVQEAGPDFAKPAQKLDKLVANDPLYVNEPEQKYKIWPTTLDQDAFRAAMDNGADTEPFEGSRIVDAHRYFALKVQDWLDAHPEERAARVNALEIALGSLLEMVVINLGTDDDPHVIFETLNARGTPLLQSDLVKNFLLHEAGAEAELLHKVEWSSFDDEWWRKEIQQGRIIRPRLDVFINYWLIARTQEDVRSSDVFRRFRRYVTEEGHAVPEVAADLRQVGDTYRSWEQVDEDSRLGQFLYRWNVMDAGVFTPLLLWIFAAVDGNETDPRLWRSLTTLESYLVRRMVCRLSTKNYNNLVIDLLQRLENSEEVDFAVTMIAYLGEQESDTRIWPDDAALTDAFREVRLYSLLTRGRLRLLLEALEENLRGPKAEQDKVPKGLTIEHVLPQHWVDTWPLDATEGEWPEAEARRNRLLHTMGNLTLVTDKLNPAMSNAPWTEKRKALHDHTVLYLNKRLLDEAPADWDEASIQARSTTLASQAAAIWPHAKQC